jgi:hypothetical protein
MIIHTQFGFNHVCCFWEKVFLIYFPIEYYFNLCLQWLPSWILYLQKKSQIL